jgi:hypothetical protein
MSGESAGDARDRLHDLGVSVAQGGSSFPPDAHNGKGHLSIQTSGHGEAGLDQILPILHDLAETFELEFLGPVADDHLRHLVGLRNILSLKLNHRQVTDAGLRHLAGLTSLRVLELRCLPVTAAGLSHFAGLHHLTELDLWNTRADDDALDALSGLAGLTELKLGGCPVTDRGLEMLAGLAGLRTLDLSRTHVRGPGLAVLGRFRELWSLDLDELPIGDAELAPLAGLTGLASLSLLGTRAGDARAGWLAGLTRLCWLYLGGTRVGDDAVRHLAGCRELITLDLDGTRVTAAGLAHLPPQLASLGLTGLPLTDADLEPLARLGGLRSLTLDEAVVTDAVRRRLRAMALVPAPVWGGDGAVAGFGRLPTCPLCNEVIDEDAPVFAARPFGCDFFSPVRKPVHWDCFATWEGRPEFARGYFEANVAAIRGNAFWGVARCDDRVLVTVNPDRYVREVDVLLAATGSSFRVPMADWEDWLDGEWFEACRHEVERDALADLIPVWKAELPTAEDVAAAAGFAPGEEPAADVPPMVERLSYEFACEGLARRVAAKGVACPHCGRFSNDHEYRRVAMVTADGPRSCLACDTCGEEFGPDDV